MCHDKKYGDILDKYTYTIDLTDLVPVEEPAFEDEEGEQEENNG